MSRTRRLIFAATALGLALAVSEAALRIAGFGGVLEYAPDDRWGYVLRPEQDASTFGIVVRVNRLGFRGPDVAEPKPPAARRIVFVGDSVTYGGAHLDEAALFPMLTARELGTAATPVDFLTVAAPAWSPQNWMAYLRVNGLREAGAVVLVLPECDLARSFSTIANRRFQETADPLRVVSVGRWAWEMARGAVAGSSWPFLDPESGPVGGDKERRQAERNLEAVAELAAYSRLQDTPLITVFVPSVPTSAYATYWPAFEAALPGAIDLRQVADAGAWLADGVHLSAEGNTRIARLITQRLREQLGW